MGDEKFLVKLRICIKKKQKRFYDTDNFAQCWDENH